MGLCTSLFRSGLSMSVQNPMELLLNQAQTDAPLLLCPRTRARSRHNLVLL